MAVAPLGGSSESSSKQPEKRTSSIVFTEEEKQSGLVIALPPETDYITYLTLVEFSLSLENLPLLFKILQDVNLTINIGWDLVHLLLPLLPQSESCLTAIADLGNPREVLLKVTESLRLLYDGSETGSLHDEEERHEITEGSSSRTGREETGRSDQNLFSLQASVLLNMLGTLHRRIKTKYPSRFISTTLQAVMVMLSEAQNTHLPQLLRQALQLAQSLLSTVNQRPPLPPRRSTTDPSSAPPTPIASTDTLNRSVQPDPEASAEGVGREDLAISHKLLAAFSLHLLELAMTCESNQAPEASFAEEAPGLALAARLFESYHADKLVPHRTTFRQMLDSKTDGNTLAIRGSLFNSIAELASVLESKHFDNLLAVASRSNDVDAADEREAGDGDVDPPNAADDVPLPKEGSLVFYVAKSVDQQLAEKQQSVSGSAQDDATSVAPIFPTLQTLVANLVSPDGHGDASVVDAVLALNLIALEKNAIGEAASDDDFFRYLQTTSLIASNSTSPSTRFHAHYIVTTVLRSHPSEIVRMSFIRDTLESCPLVNLRTVAVGWLKGEIVEANPPPQLSSREAGEAADGTIFASPAGLESIAHVLLPDLTVPLVTADIVAAWTDFKSNASYYLAVLNFVYLLIRAHHIRERLDIAGLLDRNNVRSRFLASLTEASKRFSDGLKPSGPLYEIEGKSGLEHSLAEIVVLGHSLKSVESAINAAKI